MVQKSRLSVILAKLEVTYGTDPTPDTTNDAVQVEELEITPENDQNERPSQGISIGYEKEITGKRRYKVKFKTPVVGSGAAGTEPKGVSALNQACALALTTSAGVSNTYLVASASLKSVTVYAYLDGVLHKLKGCVGTKTIEADAGGLLYQVFEMMALWAEPTDVAVPTSWTPNTTTPLSFKNVTATLDGYAIVLRSLSLKLNNVTHERGDANAADGIAGFEVVDRNPEGEIVIEALTLATKGYWAKMAADTLVTLSVVLGDTAGNIWTFTCENVKLRQLPYSEEDGIYTHPIAVQFAKSVSGNNEWQEVYT